VGEAQNGFLQSQAGERHLNRPSLTGARRTHYV
jgi:hypothetical protein